MRNLTSQVQEVLRNNVKMASRLQNLEKMYPGLIASRSASRVERRLSDKSERRSVSLTRGYRFAFEEELQTSNVYRRALLRQIRSSEAETSSKGLSWFSGMSLSDISNVSAIALPIYPMELWNHRHYPVKNSQGETTTNSLEAWYNPDAKVSRTAPWIFKADKGTRRAHSFGPPISMVNTRISTHNQTSQAISFTGDSRSLQRQTARRCSRKGHLCDSAWKRSRRKVLVPGSSASLMIQL